jgi:hypothetical protein
LIAYDKAPVTTTVLKDMSSIIGQNCPIVIFLEFLLVDTLCGKTTVMAKYE